MYCIGLIEIALGYYNRNRWIYEHLINLKIEILWILSNAALPPKSMLQPINCFNPNGNPYSRSQEIAVETKLSQQHQQQLWSDDVNPISVLASAKTRW